MRLIVGLGNPGKEYALTRHNLGFQLISLLSEKHKIRVEDYRHHALLGTGEIAGEKVMLVEPLTYMNRSGEAVRELVRFYQVPVENVIIAYDDMDLELGQIRIRPRGSGGAHNGMKSVIKCLETREVPRLRLGIGRPPEEMSVVDFVLSPFFEEEISGVNKMLNIAAQAIELMIGEGIQKAMNRYN